MQGASEKFRTEQCSAVRNDSRDFSAGALEQLRKKVFRSRLPALVERNLNTIGPHCRKVYGRWTKLCIKKERTACGPQERLCVALGEARPPGPRFQCWGHRRSLVSLMQSFCPRGKPSGRRLNVQHRNRGAGGGGPFCQAPPKAVHFL